MISRRKNQCVVWMMMFVCGVFAVQLGAGPPEQPACGNSCQLITYFQNGSTPIYKFPAGGCLRIWIDSPNTEDPQGGLYTKTATERENPTCASRCPDPTTGDVVMSCTYEGTPGTATTARNCYVAAGGLPAECVPQP